MDKDQRALIEAAVEQGWKSIVTKKGVQLRSPDGMAIVGMHGTESDTNSLRLTISRMRRHGFVWPPPKKQGGRP